MIAPTLALLLAAVTPVDPAVQAYLAVDGIDAVAVKKVPKLVDDSGWAQAKTATVLAHPQRSLRLPDQKANAHLERGPTKVRVQAAHDGTFLAVRLSWADATQNRGGADAAAFGDAAAMELPQTFGKGVRLPYVGMGDAAQKVLVYLMRAAPAGSYGREYVGAGFGSLTRSKVGGLYGNIEYDPQAQQWKAVFVRRLNSYGHVLNTGAVPIAFAVWDGNKNERGGNKALTSWKTLRLAGFVTDAAYLKELSYGYGEGEYGDPAAGKPLVESMCIACHHVGDKKLVPAGLAPSLVGIGGIATYSYLRDSINNPSLVLVPNPNVNRHYSPSGPADPHGALPNNPGFAWSVKTGNTATSKMPPFPLPPEQVANMVAYLKPRPEKN